jgi:hypothetical protein
MNTMEPNRNDVLSLANFSFADLFHGLREIRSDTDLFLASYSMLEQGVVTSTRLEIAFLVLSSIRTAVEFETEFARRGFKMPNRHADSRWVEGCATLVAAEEAGQRQERVQFTWADEIRARSLGVKLVTR